MLNWVERETLAHPIVNIKDKTYDLDCLDLMYNSIPLIYNRPACGCYSCIIEYLSNKTVFRMPHVKTEAISRRATVQECSISRYEKT